MAQRTWRIFLETFAEYQRDEGGMMGAAMVYYVLVSMTPLLVLMITLVGYIYPLTSLIDYEKELLQVIEIQAGLDLKNAVEILLQSVRRQNIAVTGASLLIFLLAAPAAFRHLINSFRKVWKIKPEEKRFYISLRQTLFDQGLALAIMIVVWILLLFAFIIVNLFFYINSRLVQILPFIQHPDFFVETSIVIALAFLFYTIAYKLLTPRKLRWQEILPASALASIIWWAVSRIVIWYISVFLNGFLYGTLGTVLLIVMWVYIGCQILFIGAEFCKVFTRRLRKRLPETSNWEPIS
jgi:membrane protein